MCSMFSNSASKNIRLIRLINRKIVKLIPCASVPSRGGNRWRRTSQHGRLNLCCLTLSYNSIGNNSSLTSKPTHFMPDQVHTVWHEEVIVSDGLSYERSGFRKSKSRVPNLTEERLREGSLLTVLPDNVHDILHHIWLIRARRNYFLVTLVELLTFIRGGLKEWSTIDWVIISKVIVHPNSSFTLRCEPNHGIIHNKGSTLVVSMLITL